MSDVPASRVPAYKTPSPVESGMTSDSSSNPNNTPILEGVILEQARQRETLKVVSAILGLIVSVVMFMIWVPGGASTALPALPP